MIPKQLVLLSKVPSLPFYMPLRYSACGLYFAILFDPFRCKASLLASNHEVKQLALLIADQVQLESEEPAHGALSPLRNTLERLVYMDALVLAYPQRCAVNEADACTFAQQHLLDKQGKRDGYLFLQFHETILLKISLIS